MTASNSPPFFPERVHIALELEIPSDVRYIERVVEIVALQCAQFAYPARQRCLNIPVALSEALSNAILRGNESTGGKQVRVRAIISDTDLVFEVVDEGPGFDLDKCTVDCTTEDNLTKEEGRGLFLMRQLMDRVESFRNQGNVVRLTLHRE